MLEERGWLFMYFKDIEIPDELIDEFVAGNVVVFAGAGVSMQKPSCCPSFIELARQIAKGTKHSINKKAIDVSLGEISNDGIDIRTPVVSALENKKSNKLHEAILKLFPSQKQIKIITTNFDLLFEKCAKKKKITIPRIYSAPALPLGKNFKGLVHLHGDIGNLDDIVIDDKSFGEAYITEGWASKFMKDVCQNYTTVFIGYSFDDTIMRYFARSLSNADKLKYIITDREDREWNVYGFCPIIYTLKDYVLHEKLIVELSKLLQFDYFQWESKVKEILAFPPSNDKNNLSLVKKTLNDESKINIFTEYAKDFSWFEWLNKEGQLEFLLKPNLELNKIQISLSKWIAKNFIEKHQNEMVLLFGKNLSSLHPVFCNDVACELIKDNVKIDQKKLNRWLILLVNASRNNTNYITFLNLVKLGKKTKRLSFVWANLNKFNLSVSKFYSENEDFCLEIEEVLDLDFYKKDFFISSLKDCQYIIYNCVRDINNFYRIRELHQDNLTPFDTDSFSISAIEEHSQNHELPLLNSVALLRDTLINVYDFDRSIFSSWVNILINDKSSLLKRLAIYAMAHSPLKVNEKAKWFIKNIDIYDSDLHHEVYQFVKICYLQMSEFQQRQLLKKIKTKTTSTRENTHKHRMFELLAWIVQETKEKKANELFLSIKKQHPDWGVRPHLDSNYYFEVLKPGKAPWSKEEIKKLKPSEFISVAEGYLSSVSNDYFYDYDSTYGFLQGIISKDIGWYTKIIKELAKTKENCDNLKDFFVSQVENIDIPINLLPVVLDSIHKISNNKITKNEIRAYNRLIKQIDVRENKEILEKIRNRVQYLNTQSIALESNDFINNDYVNTAINNPYGMITEFFLIDLSQEQKEKTVSQNNIPERYIKYFESVCCRNDFRGELGKTILGMNFSWLLYLMPQFVEKTLAPCLNENNKGLWFGLLNSSFSYDMSKLIIPYMEEKINNQMYHNDLSLYNLLVKRYSNFIFYYTSSRSLFSTKIPMLYNSINVGDESLILKAVKEILKINSLEFNFKFWNKKLKRFLLYRVKNKPLKLNNSKEVSGILDLAEYLSFAFDEYLDIVEKLPNIQVKENTYIIMKLKDDKCLMTKIKPQQIGRFLVVLLRHYATCDKWVWDDVKELFDMIKQNIDNVLVRKIILGALQIGIDLRK